MGVMRLAQVQDANERADSMSKDATQSTQELSDKLHAAQDELSKATEDAADKGIKIDSLQKHVEELEGRLQEEKTRGEGERSAAKEAGEGAAKAIKELEGKCRELEAKVSDSAGKCEQLDSDKRSLSSRLAEVRVCVYMCLCVCARARACVRERVCVLGVMLASQTLQVRFCARECGVPGAARGLPHGLLPGLLYAH